MADPINKEFRLDPSHEGIIAPEILHSVHPEGAVKFYVEFYRQTEA